MKSHLRGCNKKCIDFSGNKAFWHHKPKQKYISLQRTL